MTQKKDKTLDTSTSTSHPGFLQELAIVYALIRECKKNFFFNSRPKSIHVGVNDDEDKGNDKIEDQPDVDHLDVRSCRKALVHLHRSLK